MELSAVCGGCGSSGYTQQLGTGGLHGWFCSLGHRCVQPKAAEVQESLPILFKGYLQKICQMFQKNVYTLEKYTSTYKGIYKVN